ncbi:MAG: hypothetical protein AB1586_12990 [Pseudomonadota bacterium]
MDSFDRPRLRHCTMVADPDEPHVTLVVGRKHFQLEQLQGERSAFFGLKSYFDGRHTIRDISKATGIGERDIIGVADAFHSAGLLQQRANVGTIPVADFLELLEDTSIMWRRQIGLHRLFGGLEAGLFRREVFIGLLLETYHYVRLLSPTLLGVAQRWEDSPVRQIVLDYAREEMEHYRSYEASLNAIDRLRGHVESSYPTIGTLSLIRNFESIGSRSGLSLVCCLQLIEARAFEADDAEDHLVRIARQYDLENVIDPFVAHMRADLGLTHASLLTHALQGAVGVDESAAHEAVNDMHDIKHCFDEFHDGVIKYYDDISNYIPRPRVDYFAL